VTAFSFISTVLRFWLKKQKFFENKTFGEKNVMVPCYRCQLHFFTTYYLSLFSVPFLALLPSILITAPGVENGQTDGIGGVAPRGNLYIYI